MIALLCTAWLFAGVVAGYVLSSILRGGKAEDTHHRLLTLLGDTNDLIREHGDIVLLEEANQLLLDYKADA
tara:strand:- start:9756 stop:9968 length:213 start_codon:yes stop_codon:yes gene_type:complete